ncbi:anti-sigma factor [Pseudooceanicola sp.]|uniref:anti-sigma factor n=1 Tax=Pseudooceanicola sp. TaxID=1914328 RepID=UPI002626C660|nr:anti-sigma factor [Pseudooceanicola sp.]MDF1854360.1 anti-sigma factor [Pseudooceanicola sp.]
MSAQGDISQEDRALAGEYLLGVLEPPEARAFEARLNVEPALRAEVAAWADSFAGMTEAIAPQMPPSRVWDAVSDDVFGKTRGGFWSRIGVMPTLIGAAAAAAIAFAVVQSGLLVPEFAPEFRAEVTASDTDLRFRADYDAESGRLQLTHLAGEVAPGRSLELWLIAADAAPVSVIVWPTGAHQEAIILPAAMAAALPGALLAISDEPEGGSPTGAPTGAVLATGDVRAI